MNALSTEFDAWQVCKFPFAVNLMFGMTKRSLPKNIPRKILI